MRSHTLPLVVAGCLISTLGCGAREAARRDESDSGYVEKTGDSAAGGVFGKDEVNNGNNETAAPNITMQQPVFETSLPVQQKPDEPEGKKKPAAIERKIIYTAHLEVIVKDHRRLSQETR